MKYFMFTLRWSQTDYHNVIIQAATKKIAQEKVNKMGARYADFAGEADNIIVA